MPVLTLLIYLALLGLLAWALTTYVPMSPGMARLIQVAAIIIGALIVLTAFGLLQDLGTVPRLR